LEFWFFDPKAIKNWYRNGWLSLVFSPDSSGNPDMATAEVKLRVLRSSQWQIATDSGNSFKKK